MNLHIIIVGAGRIGKQLIELAIQDENEVYVIEKNRELAKKIATDYDCEVIVDDASSLDALKEAGAEQADALVSTLDNDPVNLMLMMLGKELGVECLVTSVADENHIPMFEKTGATTVKNLTHLKGQHFYHAVRIPEANNFMQLWEDIELVEFDVEENSKAEGKLIDEMVEEALIPDFVRFIIINRDGDIFLPKGDTEIKSGDILVALSKRSLTSELLALFRKKKPA